MELGEKLAIILLLAFTLFLSWLIYHTFELQNKMNELQSLVKQPCIDYCISIGQIYDFNTAHGCYCKECYNIVLDNKSFNFCESSRFDVEVG